jgi:RNA polymerase sigma-54 factor
MSMRQSPSLSPRLQHAIRLLQLSAADFETELQESLGSNPFLDETDTPDRASAEVEGDDDGLPTLGSAFERMAPPAGSGEDGGDLTRTAQPRGLRDHLRTQLYASRQDPRTTLAAEVLIETLDDDGYLRDDIAGSLRALDIDPPLSHVETDRALALIRQFDPPGVGARDLAECLRLQLQALDGDERTRQVARAIVDEHLDALARRGLETLRCGLACGEGELCAAVAMIRRLDPHPGSRYSAKAPDYVIPDVLVVRRRGRYVALLNPALRSRARLNQRYVDLLRGCGRGGHPAMAAQLQEARWFLRNAEQRFETIHRVAEQIVRRQSAFFRYGDVALKPMMLREVADELGLHESTVSRASGNKHMQTPRGCLPFRHFFSRELPMRSGRACSATAVRALIQELIAEERPEARLSDVDIASQLRAQGIGIARRTVSKYRHMLRLPPAELRGRA